MDCLGGGILLEACLIRGGPALTARRSFAPLVVRNCSNVRVSLGLTDLEWTFPGMLC